MKKLLLMSLLVFVVSCAASNAAEEPVAVSKEAAVAEGGCGCAAKKELKKCDGPDCGCKGDEKCTSGTCPRKDCPCKDAGGKCTCVEGKGKCACEATGKDCPCKKWAEKKAAKAAK